MTFHTLQKIIPGTLIQQGSDFNIQELVTDTRQLFMRRGGVFFAITGANHDGHEYVRQAYDMGVRGFVVEHVVKLPDDASVYRTDNTVFALQAIARQHRSQFTFPVVGVTGSNGKTIVKEWLAQMLDHKYSVVKSPKSFNSQIGVPLSIWQMSERHNIGIFEAGISQLGEMNKLEDIITPTLGIFTNLGEAHNEGFSSKEQKAEEKALLFKGCKRIIYRQDHEFVKKALLKSVSSEQVLFPWSIKQISGNEVILQIPKGELKFRLKFRDQASVENCLHCAVAMYVLGFKSETIQERLNTLSTLKMRLEMKQAVNRSYVIDDTYNNDLYGLEVAIGVLNSNQQKQRKTVILSDLYQTGLATTELYTKVAHILKTNGVNKLIGIGEQISGMRDLFQMESFFYLSTEEFLESNFNFHDETILVKGSRKFAFERIVDQLEYKAHGTVLEVNLESLIHNLNHYRALIKPETKVMAMVKAYAYGGGNHEIANVLQFHKVDCLGVAYTDEAVELRKNGVHLPIMIMNATLDSFRLIKEFNLEPEIYSMDQLMDFIEFFEGEETIPAVHVKIETGMNRLGFRENEIQRLVEQFKIHKEIRVRSIFSHLAGSEDPRHDDYTHRQVQLFDKLSQQLLDGLWNKPMRHILNTAGIVRYPEYQFDLVRLGIGLYGFDPTENEQVSVLPVGTLKSSISQVKLVKAGESIGYGRSGFAQSDTKIAVVPIGYADGYVRAFGNGVGKMLVNGQSVPTIGNVCMDMVMLDVSDVKAQAGDEVTIFGANPQIKDLADSINTIPYEILTNISQRVKRVFVSG